MSYVSTWPSKKTSVNFDEYRRAKGLTSLVDMRPEILPNGLFFESWLRQEARNQLSEESNLLDGQNEGQTP
jgi:hypothetical protein